MVKATTSGAENQTSAQTQFFNADASSTDPHKTSLRSLITLPPFIPAWFREFLPLLRGAPISVLLVYASRADRQGYAYPSLDTLQRDSGYGVNCVKEARSLLVGMNLLIPCRQERRGGKFGRKIFQMAWKASPMSRVKSSVHSAEVSSSVVPRTDERLTAAQKPAQKGVPVKGNPSKGNQVKDE
jgi:hypothetical protein